MSTPATPRAEAAQATAARLVATARRAFSEQGFSAVSLDALAEAAGVTRGALHHHFGNKAGLFEAVLREVDGELAAAMQAEYDATADPWQGFRRCFHVYLEAALAPDRRRILFQDAPAVLGMRAMDILMESGFGAMVEDLAALIAAGRIRGDDPEALGHMLNGATLNLAFWVAETGAETDTLARAHDALAALFDGLTLKA